jgi:hypothetical protein
MILWRKQASQEWLAANASRLELIAGRDLAIIDRPRTCENTRAGDLSHPQKIRGIAARVWR